MTPENVRLRLALVLAAVVSCGALGQPLDEDQEVTEPAPDEEPARAFALWLTHAESDNVSRTDTGGRGSYDGVGAFVDIGHETMRLQSSLTANLELRQYSDETIDNEPIGSVDGQLRAELVPDRVAWLLRESYGQGLTDAFGAGGPNNRESINVFDTGPELDLPLGGRMKLSLSSIFSSRRYDESDALDNDAETYQLGLFRQSSPTTRFGLALGSNDVEYDVPQAPPYNIDRATLDYERQFATGGVRFSIGTNEIDYRGQKLDEPLYDFSWNRELATRSTLRVEAAREFTDAGSTLRGDLSEVPVGGETNTILSSSPFEQKRVFVSYALTGVRTSLELSVGAADERYAQDTGLSNDNKMTRVSFSRAVTPRLQFGAELYRIAREFEATPLQPARDSDEETTSAWVNRSLGSLFDVALVLSHYKRPGNEALDEDRYEIRFSYSPSDSAAAALGAVGR